MITQESIVKRALELYFSYGIRIITMDDVANACGISKKTLYAHFENKQMLVDVAITSLIDEMTRQYTELGNGAGNAIDEVMSMAQATEKIFRQMSFRMLEELQKYYNDTWKKIGGFYDEAAKQFVLRNLERGQQEALYHTHFDNGIIADMRMQLLQCIHRETSNIANLHGFLQQVSLHYVAGLCTGKGTKYLNKFYKAF